jgi:Domain of unknown function (DUF4431)
VRRLLGLALSVWAVTAPAECLLYERDVTLTGVVNYRAKSAAILELESPVCVRSGRQNDLEINVPRDNIRLIQLVLLPSIVGPVPDSKIAVTGTLFAADAEQHRTRVLLYVKAINRAYESR